MKHVLLILLAFISLSGKAQKPEVKFTFEGIGDNREFHNGKSKSQTILGTLGSVEVGTSVDRHGIYAGVSELYEFGSNLSFHRPRLILYYDYEGDNQSFRFGSFPRRGTIDFPLAMLADTLQYFRPLIEGMAGKLSGAWGHQMAFVDWTGRQTAKVRESFMAGTSGEIRIKKWFLRNYLLMNHLAHTEGNVNGDHIRDHLGYSLLTGVVLGSENSFHGWLKGGILNSIYRERSVTDGFVTRYSFLFEGMGQYKNYSLKSTLHSGEELQFAMGDPFYRFKGYLRTDIVWYFINSVKVKGKINWSLHLVNWEQLDQSQQLSLIYVL